MSKKKEATDEKTVTFVVISLIVVILITGWGCMATSYEAAQAALLSEGQEKDYIPTSSRRAFFSHEISSRLRQYCHRSNPQHVQRHRLASSEPHLVTACDTSLCRLCDLLRLRIENDGRRGRRSLSEASSKKGEV